MLTEALGGTGCNYPHVADEKPEVSKCPETCHPQGQQDKTLGLMRPSGIPLSGNLERHSLTICTMHLRGLAGAGSSFTHAGEGLGNLSEIQVQLLVVPHRQREDESPCCYFLLPC